MGSFFFVLTKPFCRKEVEVMAIVYATLIVKGKKTLEDVPTRLKNEVQEILTALEISF